jgi:GT2 family glycosyltransferase
LRQAEEADLTLRILDKGHRLVYFAIATIVHKFCPATDCNFGERVALTARNRLLHAWLNEPFPWCLLSTANAFVKYPVTAGRSGGVRNVLTGFWRAVKDFSSLKSTRRPVSSRTMRIYLTLGRQKIRDRTTIRALYLNPPSILGILFRLSS